MSDYSVYLSTVAASAPLHGLFKVEQIEGDSVHTTTKRPVGEHGVKDFNQRADEVEVLENHLLGRRFGAGNIIGVDCDGWIPPEDWTNGTGYREMSASGTGAHIICRIAGELPQKNKIKLSAEKSKKYGVRGEIELFLGEGNGLALTGKDATSGYIDLDPSSKAARCIYAVIEDELKKEDGKATGAREEVPTDRTYKEVNFTGTDKGNPYPQIFESAELVDDDEHLKEYERMFLKIWRESQEWAQTSNKSIPGEDKSAAFMAVADRIARELADAEIDTCENGWLKSGVIFALWEKTEIYKKYYENSDNYHLAKIDATLKKAVELAEKYRGEYEHTGQRTLYQIANEIAEKKRYIHTGEKGDFCDYDAYRREWQRYTHAAALTKTTAGYVWYNGAEWKVDEHGRELEAAMMQCADNTETKARNIKKDLLRIKPKDITSKRRGNAGVTMDEVYGRGLSCNDGVIIIDADGIHITQHNPAEKFGLAPFRSQQLICCQISRI